MEPLALHGTKGEHDWSALRVYLGSTDAAVLPAHWRIRHVWAAVILNYITDPTEEHLRLIERAYELSVDHYRFASVVGEEKFALFGVQTATLRENRGLLDRLLELTDVTESIRWTAETDLLKHSITDAPESHSRWWERYNAPFTQAGLEPWELDPASSSAPCVASLFDRIRAARLASAETVDGPLVTVIVPTFNPTTTFSATVESLARQTWQNLEILIVDDASSTGGELLELAAESDPRLRVIRMPENGGAYRARNAGILSAKGEFVTVLDSDDLSHPRRIERQMRPLLADSDLLATDSLAIRTHDDGLLTNFSSTALRQNASSLLFRRAITAELGLYDPVRKAADSEYIGRIEHRFGRDAISTVREPLGLIQLTTGSLSRGDFVMGWWSGRRLAYRRQYLTWQRLGSSAGEHALRLDPSEERAFTAPRALLGLPEPARFPFGVLSGWDSSEGEFPERVAALTSLAQFGSGEPVALLNGVHPKTSPQHRSFRISTELWKAVERGDATWADWNQEARIGTLVITDPSYLIYVPTPEKRRIRCTRVVIAVDNSVRSADNDPRLLSPAWIERRCRETFGVTPEWLPGTPAFAEALARGTKRVLPPSQFLVAAPTQRNRVATDRMTVGVLPIPTLRTPERLLQHFDQLRDPLRSFDLRYLNTSVKLDERIDELGADSSVVVPRGALNARQFAASVDALIFDSMEVDECPNPAQVWNAAAQGVIPVVPQKFAADYGDLVIAFPPAELARTLAELSSDPEFQTRQRDTMRRSVSALASADGLRRILHPSA